MKDAKGHGSNGRGVFKPIPGHDYHKRSDAELRYIIKDAGEAASAAQSMGKLETKYNDQVNDAATVIGYRDRGGKQDIAAADQLHSGTSKSDPAPTHDSMTHNAQGHEWGSPEALADFKAAYGRGKAAGNAKNRAEGKAFRSGQREINGLKRQGK